MAREEQDQFGDKPRAFEIGLQAPADSARTRLSRAQAWALAVIAGLVASLAIFAPRIGLMLLYGLLTAGFTLTSVLKLACAATPRAKPSAPAVEADDALPVYTIIAPLYGEASVVGELVAALERLDYPRDRLQVLIAVEQDDVETRAALLALDLPGFIQVFVAPPGTPRTKPRACNLALEHARGDLVVVYDAEDNPHPGQLREAAARFASADPGLACLQAPLRIEPELDFMRVQFALEYAIQFEVVLPALARWGLPFPLGGTSNHFRGIM